MINKKYISLINWSKVNNIIPVIIQHKLSGKVLMLGYMNYEALKKTISKKIVTFFSRVKNRLWTKGETSGNYLKVIDIILDCDNDSILIIVNPLGNTCHLNNNSCFKYKNTIFDFLYKLDNKIEYKKKNSKNSYTKKLYKSGIYRISQKVGEESVETILAATKKDTDELINETSDLIYHILVLLHAKNLSLYNVISKLVERNKINKK
ncbi:bifunctional phosphoribosyl-AMP cyclohydrolase/phosphoribosyl-ATP diphosphatase HisIE [Buchnera aphidicola (Ceratoglyphina bambusae)]|uniref:bifunctional phosphoribosyl-AMP cyclohydrolase/phosphoribosyl-ATP diphosphatase HisIE n=1 Tax=Buchnera aphidicola TaxID=9 RepID=UPI0031B892FB